MRTISKQDLQGMLRSIQLDNFSSERFILYSFPADFDYEKKPFFVALYDKNSRGIIVQESTNFTVGSASFDSFQTALKEYLNTIT